MLVFGHRGARGYAPENTMASFKKALLLGADGLEMDVQLTKDGQIVLCHDYCIERTSNGRGWICYKTLAELKSYDFGSWFSPEYAGETIPTFEEFLDWFVTTSLLLNVEIKNGEVIYDGIEEQVLDYIMQYQILDRVIISSFYHPSITKIKQLNPKIKTGALFDCRPNDILKIIHDTAADYLHPNRHVLEDNWIKIAKSLGIGINTYTVNAKKDIEYVKALGVDGIFTDYPDAAR